MKAATAAKKVRTKKQPATDDLPHMVGKGVAPKRIPKIDQLADKYVERRDARMLALTSEVEAKTKLIEALHFHGDDLRLPNGWLSYRFGDLLITLEPGKEKLSVKTTATDGSEE